MSAFEVKGWCPGALRPMMSGDGLVVRVRPRGGYLTPEQARGLADVARRYGSGIIDLSTRANLQLRGVGAERHGALLDALGALDLLDAREDVEARRNIVVTPFRDAAGGVARLASALEATLAETDLPLPSKFGFAVDCGDGRVLAQASADVRIERTAEGGLIVRADGAPLGIPVSEANAVATALQLARWFIDSGGVSDGRGRMARHVARGVRPPQALFGSVAPVAETAPPRPGLRGDGALVAIAFGSMRAETLERLAQTANNLRLTPWRMVFLPGADQLPDANDLVTDADDPILRVESCPGAPLCPQALSETRTLARQLAPSVPQGAVLHVSGCSKGCACQRPTALTLIGTADGFDLVRNGTAQSPPLVHDLHRDDLAATVATFFGGGDGLHV